MNEILGTVELLAQLATWLSRQRQENEAEDYLQSLLASGIYGRSVPDIIKRFIDAELIRLFILPPSEKVKVRR